MLVLESHHPMATDCSHRLLIWRIARREPGISEDIIAGIKIRQQLLHKCILSRPWWWRAPFCNGDLREPNLPPVVSLHSSFHLAFQSSDITVVVMHGDIFDFGRVTVFDDMSAVSPM